MFDSIYSATVTPAQFFTMAAAALVSGFLYSWIMSFRVRSTKRFFIVSALIPFVVGAVITFVNGNTTAAMALEFGILIIYIIYVFLMSKTSTIAGVWTAEWVYNILIGLISLVYIWKADWGRKRI